MAFIALTTNLGLCVDGLWVPDRSGPPVGPRAPDAETPLPKIVALQGIHDPDGLYVTFDCALPADTPNLALTCQMLPAERQAALESDTRQAVADVVAAALPGAVAEAKERDLGSSPQFALAFVAGGCKDACIAGIFAGLGDVVPVGGGGAWEGIGGAPAVFHGLSGGATSPVVTHDAGEAGAGAGGGIVGVLCWSSVHVAGAFCHGLCPDKTCTGEITGTRGPYIITEIDGERPLSVLRKWSPDATDDDMASLAGVPRVLPEGVSIPFRADLAGDPENSPDSITPLGLLGLTVGEAAGESVYNVSSPQFMYPEDGSIGLSTAVRLGQRVTCMRVGDSHSVFTDRVAHVARQVARNAGVDVNRIVGCFSYNSSLNWVFGGDRGMGKLAEDISDNLGWVPSLGIMGTPEFGLVGDGRRELRVGCMSSAIVLTDVPVQTRIKGRNFRRSYTQRELVMAAQKAKQSAELTSEAAKPPSTLPAASPSSAAAESETQNDAPTQPPPET